MKLHKHEILKLGGSHFIISFLCLLRDDTANYYILILIFFY